MKVLTRIVVASALLAALFVVDRSGSDEPAVTGALSEAVSPVVDSSGELPGLGPVTLANHNYVLTLHSSFQCTLPLGGGGLPRPQCLLWFGTINHFLTDFTVDATDSVVCTIQPPFTTHFDYCPGAMGTDYLQPWALTASAVLPCENTHFATAVITDSVSSETVTVQILGHADTAGCI